MAVNNKDTGGDKRGIEPQRREWQVGHRQCRKNKQLNTFTSNMINAGFISPKPEESVGTVKRKKIIKNKPRQF